MGTTGATLAPARPRATDEDRLPEALGSDAEPLTRAERRAEAAMGAAFLCAAAIAAFTLPTTPIPGVWVLVMSVATMALASAVRLAVPGGRAVPVMLVSVPVVFLVPPGLFPLVTAAALLLGALPAAVLGRARPDRLLLVLPNAWFAMGPAVVLGLWGAFPARESRPAVLAAALLAQIAVDVAAAACRERLLAGPRLGEQLRASRWVHVVDLALAPVGYAVAMAVGQDEWALLLVVPMLWLLHRFSTQRAEDAARLREIGAAYRATALALGDAPPSGEADADEPRSVLALALDVADALGLEPERRRLVEFGVLLRDIGPDAVPEGDQGGVTGGIGRVVTGLAERWDGGGPAGLADDAIPLESRIVAVCDVWHTITGAGDGAVTRAALAELRAAAGTRLDPVVVAVLARLVTAREVPPGAG